MSPQAKADLGAALTVLIIAALVTLATFGIRATCGCQKPVPCKASKVSP